MQETNVSPVVVVGERRRRWVGEGEEEGASLRNLVALLLLSLSSRTST